MRRPGRNDREQARLVSAVIDGLVLARRCQGTQISFDAAGRREVCEFSAFAQAFNELTIVPPEDFGSELHDRLLALGTSATRGRPDSAWSALVAVRVAVPSAVAATLVAVVLVVVRSLVTMPVASASEIVSRSDAALVRLVRPGEVLHRRWKVSTVTTDAGGAVVRRGERMIHEWQDGGDVERVAGRWYSTDDRLLVAYTSVPPSGERRPHVYFSPGVYGEELGLLSVEPTREELEQAVQQFPAAVRPALRDYLNRQYMYLPITGERRFNHAILEAPSRDSGGMPRLILSLDPAGTWQSIPVYRVRVVDPTSIAFNWRSAGPPRVRPVRSEIVRYIARDSFLGVRMEQTDTFEDGRKTVTVKELVETRTVRVADLSLDPFRLEVPDGTPMQRQSAVDLLSGVAGAIRQPPPLTSIPGQRDTRAPVDE